MNRFKRHGNILRIFSKIHLTYIAFVVVIVLVGFGLSTLSNTTSESKRDSLESAIRRDVMHCYAIEGTYPPSLSYMEQHYGLTYDKTEFFVDYQSNGGNLIPDITIIELK